jgi:16S rRNA processing protein RimM
MWFNVGKIVNTHGLDGEVRVIAITDFREERFKIGNTLNLFIYENAQPISLKVKSHRIHKNFDLLTFEGYNDINEVEKWKNGILKVSNDQLGELNEGEFYFHEIVGCNVVTTTNEVIGVVTEILTPGANDVWVVKGENGKEYLIPYIEDVVKQIDVVERRIIIEPMEGLLS